MMKALYIIVLLAALNAFGANFSNLKNHHTGESIQLTPGDRIVADFVAPWCGSCLKSSPQLETWVENVNDKRIKFLPINIDQSNPKLTKFFLKKSKLRDLWNDENGSLYQQIGNNAGVPLIVLAEVTDENGTIKILKKWIGETEKSEVIRTTLQSLK